MGNADIMLKFFLQLLKAVCTLIGTPESPLFYMYSVIFGLMIVCFGHKLTHI